MLEGFRELLRFGESLLKTGFMEAPYLPSSLNLTDAAAMAFIRGPIQTIYHYCGTCKMGKQSDDMAVVDSRLRVIGVKGLRVADASIMPEVTSGNTNQPSMMIGARCAQISKNDHNL